MINFDFLEGASAPLPIYGCHAILTISVVRAEDAAAFPNMGKID